jgi:hypothetical protein
MAYSYKILVYNQSGIFDNTEYYKSIGLQFFNDIEDIKRVIVSPSSTTQYMVIFCDEPDAHDITEIEENCNVIHTLNCNNSTDNMPKLRDYLRISENLLVYQAAFYSMNFYQLIAKILNESGQEDLGKYFQNEAEKQFQWLRDNIQVLYFFLIKSIITINYYI